MKQIPFFITGQPRSGTSLLCEIIAHYPKIKSVPQPFPLLLYFLSSTFNEQQNQSKYYPITPLFLENNTFQDYWLSFLTNYDVPKKKMSEIVLKSQRYSGVYSKSFLKNQFDNFEGSFYDLINKTSSCVIKEVFAEDYIPYFLHLKTPTLLIIRDPRDMIASLQEGNQMGDLRGIYFHLLMWRKSVAFALEYNSSPHFKFILLEDLLNDLPSQLKALESFLGNQHFPTGLLEGKLIFSEWKSNSNSEDIPKQVISRTSDRKDHLTQEQKVFIETICFPEMKALNYAIDWPVNKLEHYLQNIADPISYVKEAFPSNWVWTENTSNQELKRIKLLKTTEQNQEIIKKYFLFSSSYKHLKNCFG
jgi:hypothetical protein